MGSLVLILLYRFLPGGGGPAHADEWSYKEGEVRYGRKPRLGDYIRLWQLLEKYDVWSLESPLEILQRIKSTAEDPYQILPSSQETYKFRFRIWKTEHSHDVYYIEGLKDKRYELILHEMNRFLD